MRKGMLGKTDMEVSSVVFGGIICMQENQNDSDRFVSCAVDNGVSYFDVAPSYGDAEQRLGPSLEPYRKSVILACKTTERSAKGAGAELENSLKNLRTDYFDIYQMHAVNTLEEVNAIFADDGAMQVFIKARDEGLIRHIGITSHNAETALAALELFDFSTVLFPVNWALGLGKDFEKTLPEVCAEKQIGLLGMKTLAYRKWYDDEVHIHPKSWCKIIHNNNRFGKCALKYTLSRGAAAVVPPGNFESFMFCVNNIDECLSSPLSSEDIAFLREMLPGDDEHIL